MKMNMKNGMKKEKQNGFKSKEERSEQIQADHELFLQAFESKLLIFIFQGCATVHDALPCPRLNTKSAVFRANSNIPVSPDQKFDFSHISKPQSHIYEEAHDQEQ